MKTIFQYGFLCFLFSCSSALAQTANLGPSPTAPTIVNGTTAVTGTTAATGVVLSTGNAGNSAVPNGPSTVNNNANMTPNVAAASNNNKVGWIAENTYWSSHYLSQPYANAQRDYTTYYQPAYRYGVDLYNQNLGKPYGELNQSQLRAGWADVHGTSNLSWNEAEPAARDAYNRLYDSHANSPSHIVAH